MLGGDCKPYGVFSSTVLGKADTIWYFLNMPRNRRSTDSSAPEQIPFHRSKYGREILIDVAWIHEMPTFLEHGPNALQFYDVLLVTAGRGWYALDGHRYRVAPGQVFFTSPGQIRQWRVKSLDGVCLFFPEEFLADFFNDPLFLDRLPYFRAASDACSLSLPSRSGRRMLRHLTGMRSELLAFRHDTPHLLRAQLYEILVSLARHYTQQHGTPPGRTAHGTVERFVEMVSHDPTAQRSVERCAKELSVTPGHLSRLCREHLGESAKRVAQRYLELRARRLLIHSSSTIGEVAQQLGFNDLSYFSRFFRRRTGVNPNAFRKLNRAA